MRKTKIIVNIILIIVLLFSVGKIALYYGGNYIEEKEINSLEKEIKINNNNKIEKLKKKNKDAIGWLKVEGTNISYPVVMTKKNQGLYYENHNFNKQYSEAGSIFADCRYENDSKNLLIYGHHMKVNRMFNELDKFKDKEFFNKPRYIGYRDEKGLHKYEIFMVAKTRVYNYTPSDFAYADYAYIGTEEIYKEYIEGLKKIALYKKKFPENEENLITLSTCSNHRPDKQGRFIIVGREI